MFQSIRNRTDHTQFDLIIDNFLKFNSSYHEDKTVGLKHLKLLDFDGLFATDGDARALTCGDQDMASEKQTKEYIKTLFHDNNANLNFVASCECGALVGNYYTGMECPDCKQEAHTNFADELKYRAWLEIPDYMPPILHPVAFNVLNDWLRTFQQAPVLSYLLDVDKDLPAKFSHLGQGFKYFYENFDDIVNFFMTKYVPATPGDYRERCKYIPMFIKKYRNIMFVRHVPILNQSLHLITRSGSMSFSDECSKHFLKARVELSKLMYAYNNSPVNDSFLDQHLYSVFQSYMAYVDSITKVKLAKKKGYIRKCILGSRYHCSFRGVIIPITGVHTSDELVLPWRIGVAIFKEEIFNVLTNRMGYSTDQALAKHARAIVAFDQEIADIFKTLIKECPYKGLPILFNRNPSIQHGAIQLLFVIAIKSNMFDDTISWSARILKACNALRIRANIFENLSTILYKVA